uniref:Uncharacterized protein n=1 Tax=Brassica oleracea TaxID=3712 RepID=A0A3P6FC34_BRAOL|nr:unnamed protein product [Brassica oleracea]
MLRGYQNSSCLSLWVMLFSLFLVITLKQSSGNDENFFTTQFMAPRDGSMSKWYVL